MSDDAGIVSRRSDANKASMGNRARFRTPKPIRVSDDALVRSRTLSSCTTLPLLVEPVIQDLNLATWCAQNREAIRAQLGVHGAVLFTGFSVKSVFDFQQIVQAVCGELLQYTERSSPRSSVGHGVYTSTDHPPTEPILLHCEQSYTLNWPMKISFHCIQAPQIGGGTPLADTRIVYRNISDRSRKTFREKGVMYVRNYGSGAGLSWQEAFGTDEATAVEMHCLRNGIDYQWLDRGCLRTRQVRPAIRLHPETNEEVWFNHALFFNLAGLEPSARQSLLSVLNEEEVPFNTFYGDGSPIEPSVLEEIRSAYDAATTTFTWKEGDILLVDNMLAAHGRERFSGPRSIVVAMSEPFNARREAG